MKEIFTVAKETMGGIARLASDALTKCINNNCRQKPNIPALKNRNFSSGRKNWHGESVETAKTIQPEAKLESLKGRDCDARIDKHKETSRVTRGD